MGNSKNLSYQQLLRNPPKIEVKKNAKQVIITTISCMCDNEHTLSFKKNDNGEFKLFTGSSAFSNWQMKCDQYDLEWAADEGDWKKVFRLINESTEKVGFVRSR